MTTGRMLSRKAIAYLADLLSKTLRVYDLRTILDKLELPRSYASGFSKHEKISSVFPISTSLITEILKSLV